MRFLLDVIVLGFNLFWLSYSFMCLCSLMDLLSFLHCQDGDLKYTLYGVLVHHGGSTRSGHYYCYVRTSGGTWYALDDNRVCDMKSMVPPK